MLTLNVPSLVSHSLTAQMLHNIQCQSRHPTHAKFYWIFCYTISELEGWQPLLQFYNRWLLSWLVSDLCKLFTIAYSQYSTFSMVGLGMKLAHTQVSITLLPVCSYSHIIFTSEMPSPLRYCTTSLRFLSAAKSMGILWRRKNGMFT